MVKKKKNRSHTLAIFLDLKKQCKSIPCLKYASLIWSPISRMLCDCVPVMCTKDLAAFRVNVDSYETHVTLTGVCVYNRIQWVSFFQSLCLSPSPSFFTMNRTDTVKLASYRISLQLTKEDVCTCFVYLHTLKLIVLFTVWYVIIFYHEDTG